VRRRQNLFLISCLLFAWGIPKPVTMIIFGASINGLMLPFFALAMMILSRRVDKQIACNWLSYLMLTVTTIIAVGYIYANLKNFFEKLMS
jgi:Mn2+/Fe2+ NRAMP family transporter